MSKRAFLASGLLFFVLGLGVFYFSLKAFNAWLTPPKGGEVKYVFYEVQRNQTVKAIAQDLEGLGVVSNPLLFYWYGRITGRNGRIKSADYRLSNQMSPQEVFDILTSGISYGFPVPVPEGFNLEQIGQILEKIRPHSGRKFIHLCKDKHFIAKVAEEMNFNEVPFSLEGYLFPETYSMTRKTTEEELIRNMVRKYRQVFTKALVQKANQMGFTEHQMVTLASIIEKETGAPQERPLISSVFHNRLKKKMRLQSDPTIIYGMENYNGNIRKKDILRKSPWNTYVIPALPIGPISNPGKESLLAALNPAESDYLYFVSHNDGTHEFTTNLKDHDKAVARYQLNKSSKEGRSWKELSKALGKIKD
ncbi:MAG: endolytic transglycosylase MltG [Bacteriovoracia bacterium]